MVFDDWLGLLPTYGVIIGIGLLLAFIACNLLLRKRQYSYGINVLLYALAGAFSLCVMLVSMQPIMDITLIAGARGNGIYAQMLAGFFGGIMFASFDQKEN